LFGNAVDEGLQLFLQGLFFFYGEVSFNNLFAVFSVYARPSVFIIKRYIGILLKDPYLTHSFIGYPAGGKIGYAAVLERYPSISDILKLREDIYAYRFNRFYLGGYKTKDYIDIMDHDIENCSHVKGAVRKRTEAVAFDEFWLFDERFCCRVGGIEAFYVADLQGEVVLFGGFNHRIRFLEAHRKRFLHEGVYFMLQEVKGNPMVESGGHGDADRFDLIEELFVVGIAGDV
jgi:hypothetical protein